MLGRILFYFASLFLSLADKVQYRNRMIVGRQKFEATRGLLGGMSHYVTRNEGFKFGAVTQAMVKHIRRNVLSAASEVDRAEQEGAR